MADNYAFPEVLVTTEWVEKHLEDAEVRFAEVDVDTKAYEEGHIPGAVGWNWQTQLSDQVRRDLIPKDALERLLGESGIDNKTVIVLYGDNNNWFAAWAFWQLKIYGHRDVRIMDGGRKKWISEGRLMSRETSPLTRKNYRATEADNTLRAFLPEVPRNAGNGARARWAIIDVRSNDEYTGKILSPPGLPETCQRGGHIPGALNIPWGKNVNDDGTFKRRSELQALYDQIGVTPDKQIVAYCRIGERSSLTWFVLKYLLGYENVKNYDGSWTEWGNLVNAPVVQGAQP